MRVLLDTHAFVWWVADSRRLSETARGAIRNEGNDILIAQALAHDLAIVSNERLFESYGVSRLW